jgi:hypothetical protein
MEVYAAGASAKTFFLPIFKFWHPENALANHSRFWESYWFVRDDYWQAHFAVPQKLDQILIEWRHPPQFFRVYFQLDGNSPMIPCTENYPERNKSNKVGREIAIVFNKPIIASVLRIEMHGWTPPYVSFSINKVRFYVKQSYVIVTNQMIKACNSLCLYINTDKPRIDTPLEMYNCSQAIVNGRNNEIFIYTGRRALLHENSKLCVGFKNTEVVLKKCNPNNPEYKIQFHSDSSIYFDGFAKDCWFIEEPYSPSSNYVDNTTEIIVTSEADDKTFHKDNIRSKYILT